jgi:hypothetical protein
MKFFTPQMFYLGAAMLPLAATTPDPTAVAISDKLASAHFKVTELAKVEKFIDFLARQAEVSVICTLESFHLGQDCREIFPACHSNLFNDIKQMDLPVFWPPMSCILCVLSLGSIGVKLGKATVSTLTDIFEYTIAFALHFQV